MAFVLRSSPPTPLEDPACDPVHQPVNGTAPAVVEKWGPRSQVRWFERFRDQLAPQRADVWDRYYCASLLHRGSCCPSCLDDEREGYRDWDAELCCCRGIRRVTDG